MSAATIPAKVHYVFAEGEAIVAMVDFNGQILVATNRHVYRLTDDGVEPLRLEMKEPDGGHQAL